nr:uncharacterized protein LOC127301641 [Lolium perenne]
MTFLSACAGASPRRSSNPIHSLTLEIRSRSSSRHSATGRQRQGQSRADQATAAAAWVLGEKREVGRRGGGALEEGVEMTRRRRSRPTCGGTHPTSSSPMSTILLSVSAILPMEGGMQPPSLLCASTTTPRLVGMGLQRRLELRKMASSGRSKSAGGMAP